MGVGRRSHQWGCFGVKKCDKECEKTKRVKRKVREGNPISLADEFTSRTCSAVSPEIKDRFRFFCPRSTQFYLWHEDLKYTFEYVI